MQEATFSPPIRDLGRNDSRVRLGVLSSGNGSNFEAIVAATRTGALNAEVAVVVVNNPQAGTIARAERLAIPSVLVNHRDYTSREGFDDAVVHALKTHNVDWVIMAGWMRISTRTLIDAFPDRIVNLHPSLLPSFPGYDAIGQALRAGVRFTGCTVHIVRVEVDSGPIIAQACVLVDEHDTAEMLATRIHAAEHRLYPPAIGHAIALHQTR